MTRGLKASRRYHILFGTGVPILGGVRDLAPMARHVVAVGPCIAYGGVTTAGGNPSDAVGCNMTARIRAASLPLMPARVVASR